MKLPCSAWIWCVLAIFLTLVDSWQGVNSGHSQRAVRGQARSLSMKWTFGKGSGPLREVGGLGSQGEYYYIPSKRPTLKAPAEALGKDRVIPLFPRNQVLVRV